MKAALLALLMLTVAGPTAKQTVSTHKQIAEELIPSTARAAAPDFTLPDVYGKPITLSKYKGKVVLLDFWATTCGGCKVELPWYVDFDARYRSKGLSVVGLDMYGESPEVIKPFLVKSNIHYAIAVGTDAIGDSFHLKEMPLTVLIDKDGRIALSHAGIVDKVSFEKVSSNFSD